VVTDRTRYEADRVILCTGAWLPTLVPALPARVFRQVQFWFEPDGAVEGMPVFIRVPDAATEMFYGFPPIDGALKIAGEQFEHAIGADDLDREVAPAEVAGMHALASPHLRITASCVRAVACKYTVTPDFAFVIDRHPASERVWLASACSGHGFKHSAAVGEALAELAATGATRFDLSAFQLSRFTP
jgi:sarcosine oxidase